MLATNPESNTSKSHVSSPAAKALPTPMTTTTSAPSTAASASASITDADLDNMFTEIFEDSPELHDAHEFPLEGESSAAFPVYSNAFAEMQTFLTSPMMDGFDMAAPLFPDDSDLPAVPDLVADTSPTMDSSPLQDFLTTPMMQDVHDFNVPLNQSASHPLAQPVIVSDADPMELIDEDDFAAFIAQQESANKSAVDEGNKLGIFTPSTPLLPSFDSVTPSAVSSSTSRASSSTHAVADAKTEAKSSASTRRLRSSYPTGTRRNITSASLIPLDAPTQTRNYSLPSATSRKEVPATFARKRLASAAFADEEEICELPPNPTERDMIEHKRRQNTLAARKSRKRKLEHQLAIENQNDELKERVVRWRARAHALRDLCVVQGMQVPDWEDDDEDDE